MVSDELDQASTVLVTLTDAQGCVVATVCGDVDLATVDDVTAPLLTAVAARPGGLVVDTTGVTFFGAAGMQSLDVAVRRAIDHGVPVALVCGPVVRRVLDLLDAHSRFDVQPTWEDAVAALIGHAV